MKDLNKYREKIINMSENLTVESIANFFRTTPENIQRILDGEEIEISEQTTGNKSVVQVTTKVNVHKQRVIAVWRTKGGVGATVTAINLAKMISTKQRTLLICLNFSEGGSDLIQYLDLPYFPLNAQALKENFGHYTELQNNLFVMHPVTSMDYAIEQKDIKNIIIKAREDFDCIVLDLPNSIDPVTIEAVNCSNTVAFIYQGGNQEGQRIAKLAQLLSNKKQIFIANQGLSVKDCKSILPVDANLDDVIEIPFDRSIKERLDNQSPYLPPNSPFYKGIEKAYNDIFNEINKAQANGGSLISQLKYSTRKIRRKVGNFVYAMRILDVMKEGFYVATCAVVLVAALYSMDIPFVKVLVDKFVPVIDSF